MPTTGKCSSPCAAPPSKEHPIAPPENQGGTEAQRPPGPRACPTDLRNFAHVIFIAVGPPKTRVGPQAEDIQGYVLDVMRFFGEVKQLAPLLLGQGTGIKRMVKGSVEDAYCQQCVVHLLGGLSCKPTAMEFHGGVCQSKVPQELSHIVEVF